MQNTHWLSQCSEGNRMEWNTGRLWISLFLVFHAARADVTCRVEKRQRAEDVGISKLAAEGINYREGQSEGSLQVLRCTCDRDEDDGTVSSS